MNGRTWQRTQNLIAHVALILGAALPFYFFQVEIPTVQKIAIITIGYIILIPTIRYLHRKFAKTFVRVVNCEYDVAARVVQRTLNAQRMPFTKSNGDERIIFQIRSGNMQLAVDTFPLNMMYDDNLTTQIASKLTLQPLTMENQALMHTLRSELDQAFQHQGY